MSHDEMAARTMDMSAQRRQPADDASNTSAARETPIVVTLVHGTFARGAPWTQDGSILRKRIADEMATQNEQVIFGRFDWSGRNTHKARVKAGYELANHIRDLRKSCPNCRHFIIAHSHGGNVALLAHKHLEPQHHATGIATLGTPFITAKVRNYLVNANEASLRTDREEGFWPGALGWLLGLIVGLMTAFTVFSQVESWGTWGGVSAVVAGLTVWSVLGQWLPKVIATITFPISARRAAMKLGNALALKPMPRTSILSFVYPGDEAGRVLGALQQTSALPNKLVDWFKEVGFPVMGLAFMLVFFVGIFNAPITDLTGIDPKTYDDWATYILGGIMISAAVAWLAIMSTRYVLSFLRGHPAGFGWERPSIHAHIDISVGPTASVPKAKSNRHREVPFTADDDAKRGLRHSGLYEDGRILKSLAYWMAIVH